MALCASSTCSHRSDHPQPSWLDAHGHVRWTTRASRLDAGAGGPDSFLAWARRHEPPHGFTAELNTVGGVCDPVENGVSNHGVVDIGVPLFERQLSGKQNGGCSSPRVDDIKQILLAALRHRRETEVVKNKKVEAGQGGTGLADRPILMSDGQIFEQLIGSGIANGQTMSRDLAAESASEMGLACAGGSGEDQVLSS